MSSQSKIESFVEALVNVAIGYPIAVVSQIIIFPMFGIHIALGTNFIMGIYFTVVSIARSYVVRRFFNSKLAQFKAFLSRKIEAIFNESSD